MSVKSGKCVKTAAQVMILEYGRVAGADIFVVGDNLVINFGGEYPENGHWPEEVPPTHQVTIGMDGFFHSKKGVLVVPRSHLIQGGLVE